MQLPDYNVSDFGKVAVLMGGRSTERHISLESGQAVYRALCLAGVDAHAIDFDQDSFTALASDNFDHAFIMLHGRGGEDGTIQGTLEILQIPYTGSGVLGSALAMDKIRSKAIWNDSGLPTPASIELSATTDWDQVVEELGLPMMVKPVREGSSIGASKVVDANKLISAWEHANQFDHCVMAEPWISGDEYTISILNNHVLPIIKLETQHDFYNYQAKYEDRNTKYICPCGLNGSFEKEIGEIALSACNLIGVSGWGRVDILIDNNQQPWLIEVNTVPGMTNHSLVPMAAKQAGISFEQLVLQILATSLFIESTVDFENR